MLVVLYREIMGESIYSERMVSGKLFAVLSYNCSQLYTFKKQKYKERKQFELVFLKWLVAWRETVLADRRIINVHFGLLFGALYHLYCLLTSQIKELHLKLGSTLVEYILAVQFT